MDDKKLISAIDLIIRDVDKKYDECLVDKFLEFIHQYSNQHATTIYWFDNIKFILDRLKSYFDNKAFVMMNQARAYKVFHSIIKNNLSDEPKLMQILQYIDSFLCSMGSVIINENLSAVSLIMSIIKEIIKTRYGFKLALRFKFNPIVKLKKGGTTYHMDYIIYMTGTYLALYDNYHVKNKAEELLEAMIICSVDPKLGPRENPDIVASIMTLLKPCTGLLLASRNSSITTVYNRLLDSRSGDKEFLQSLKKIYDVEERVTIMFMSLVIDKNYNIPFFKELCKCSAKVDSTIANVCPRRTITSLLKEDLIEACIIYLTSHKNRRDRYDNLLLYTILQVVHQKLKLEDKKIENELEKLTVTCCQSIKDKKIDKLTPIDKLVTTSITSLKQVLSTYANDVKKLVLIKDILLKYIQANYESSRDYKNIMECCDILYSIMQFLDSSKEATTRANFKDNLLEVILSMKPETAQSRLILFNLLKSIKCFHQDVNLIKSIIELANKFTDPNALNEFIEFLNCCDEGITLMRNDDNLKETCTKLLRYHVHDIAKQTEHMCLIKNLYTLFILLNQEVDHNKELSEFKSIAENYLSEHNYEKENDDNYVEVVEFQVNNSSIVDEIINYEQIADGIMDCY